MWQRRLEQIFSAYLTTNPRFLQARLIGVADGGKELVRVDGKSGVVRITPADQLQRKGDRDYFLSTLELAERQVHISDFNLNRERGRVEQPPVRTLRVATPIYTSSGKVFGILVLNVGADTLLPPVAELHQGTPSGLGC